MNTFPISEEKQQENHSTSSSNSSNLLTIPRRFLLDTYQQTPTSIVSINLPVMALSARVCRGELDTNPQKWLLRQAWFTANDLPEFAHSDKSNFILGNCHTHTHTPHQFNYMPRGLGWGSPPRCWRRNVVDEWPWGGCESRSHQQWNSILTQ